MGNSDLQKTNKVIRFTVVMAFVAIVLYFVLIVTKLINPGEIQISDSSYAADILFPEDAYPQLTIDHSAALTTSDSKAKICLIIDDFGNNWSTPVVQELLEFPIPITIAVIPGLWASDSTAIKAHGEGKEVIVHLPMEPIRKIPDREKVFLSSEMDNGTFAEFMSSASKLPYSIGLNNHMGSLATQDRPLMTRLAKWCGPRGWIILDSITHPGSVLYAVAQEELVPCLKRDIFLDHDKDLKSVESALAHAVRVAKKRKGRPVIVIGHPRQATLEVLRNNVPGLLNEGIEFISLSQATQTRSH